MSRTQLFSIIRPRPTGVGGPRRLFLHVAFFFCFSCLGKERKKVTERREIPFPFCHTPLFALYSLGPPFCPWYSFVFPVYLMCIPRVLMWAGNRALFEPGLCIHVRWRHWKAGCTFALGQDLGARETEITYTGHLLDSAVLLSDVLFPRILLHLHLWLFEHCQPGASSQHARESISGSGSVSA